MANAVWQGHAQIFEWAHHRLDGTPFWVEVNLSGIEIKGELFMQAVVRDITERKKAEEALRVSEEKHRGLVENLPQRIFHKDANSVYMYCNRNCADDMGIAAHEIKGKNDFDFYPKELAEKYRADDRRLMESGQTEEIEESYTKGGQEFVVQTVKTPLTDDAGNVSGILGIFWDITERKRAEEALKGSEQKYRTVVEESFNGIFVQKGTVITFANSRLHEMLGYDQGELEGLDHWLIYHPDYRELARSGAQARLRGESALSRYEVELFRKDGGAFPGEINAKVIFFDNEPGIQVWIRDLTQQKLLEKRLIQAQKMQAVGTLAGGIAHDFNNLLTIILGYSELALVGKKEGDPAHGDLKTIFDAAGRGADLVKQILTFSRDVETAPKPTNLNHQVEHAQKLLYKTIPKMIEIQTHLADDLKVVMVDPTQIEQVLLNLAVNAQHAMPDGGRLVFETKNITLDEEYCKTHLEAEPGEYVMLMVSDIGHGIEKEALEHIFEPFYSTKKPGEGTGLGLAMVDGIVKQNRGFINCYSEPGVGTTFKIYLPTIDLGTKSDVETSGVMLAFGTETILLVDDEELIRDLGQRHLIHAGYTVLTAVNGQEALEIYERQRADISLVILDLIMPEMGGRECLEELLKINPDVKVLIASGFSVNGPTRDGIEGGARGFVGKPFDMKQLLQTVRKVLDEE